MITLASDSPIFDPALDKFSRWPFAQRIAQTIVNRKDPSSLIIGIYGSWGDGKTTVLNFIENELIQHPEIVCIKFNPWRFSDETRMLLGFYNNVANALGKSITTDKEKIGEFINKYGQPLAAIFDRTDFAESVSKLLSTVEIEEVKSRVNNFLSSEGKRVVILIDDIDRLDKNEIQSLFRLVKLNADFVNTAYILAFDDEMVAAAIQEKYSTTGSESGRGFLEKIIQVPLDLPAIPTLTLREFCFSKVNQALEETGINLTEEEAQDFVNNYAKGLEIRVKTPRMATRYGNILSFALPILIGEVYQIDLMLIEGIRIFYPVLYDTIRSNPDIFLITEAFYISEQSKEDEKTKVKDNIEVGMKGLNSEEKKNALHLLQFLFPKLQSIYGNVVFDYGEPKTWAQQKRVASKYYFTKYFSYSLLESDVPDVVIEKFIQSIERITYDKLREAFYDLIKTKNVEKVVSKLRYKSDLISSKSSTILALLIAEAGSAFPKKVQPFTFRGAFSEAAMLIRDLVTNIPDKEDAQDLANNLISKAQPITFAIEIFSWLKNKGSGEQMTKFTDKEKEQFKKIIANRISDISSKINIVTEFPNDSGKLLNIWANWRSKEEAETYLETILNNAPEQMFILLSSVLPYELFGRSETPSRGDLEQDQYNYLSEIINPAKIFTIIENRFGEKIISEDYPISRKNESFELRVSQQFAWFFLKGSRTK